MGDGWIDNFGGHSLPDLRHASTFGQAMTARKKPSVGFWITVALVTVMVEYPLSFGSACCGIESISRVGHLGDGGFVLPSDPLDEV